MPEPVFNKVKLETLLKKTPTQVFLVNFSKSLRATFCKTPTGKCF